MSDVLCLMFKNRQDDRRERVIGFVEFIMFVKWGMAMGDG